MAVASAFLKKHENFDKGHLSQLINALKDFVEYSGQAVALNKRIIGPEMQPFQEKAESSHKNFSEEVSKLLENIEIK